MSLEVAETILQQLGGRTFALMTGAKHFAGDERSLMFGIPRTRGNNQGLYRGVNKIRITLDSSDTYTFEAMRIRKKGGIPECETLVTKEHVYDDNLQEVFSSITGLDTRMPRVVGL